MSAEPEGLAPRIEQPPPGPWTGSRFRRVLAVLVLATAGLIALAVSLSGLFDREELPAGHDVWVHAVNAFEFARCIGDGVPWPRWLPDLCGGYGGPNPLYYGPLAHHLSARFMLLGLPVHDALRAAAAAAMALSFAGMFVWARHNWGRAAGFLAATLYLFAPYHLVDLYIRFAYPELLGLAVAPWLFWAAQRAAETGRGMRAVPAVLALAAVTHNLSAFLFGLLLVAYLGCLALDPEHRRGALAVAFRLPIAAGLAAFFWMPALIDAYQVRLPRDPSVRTGYAGCFLEPSHLLESHWPGSRAHLPLYPGRLHLALGVAGIGAAAVLAARGRARARTWTAFGLVSAGTLLLTLGVSRPIWQVTPLPVLQFPWRFLGLAAFGLAFVSPVALWPLRRHPPVHRAACGVLACIVVLSGAGSCQPAGRRLLATTVEGLRSSWQTGDLDSQFMPTAALVPGQFNRPTFEVASGNGAVRVDLAGSELHRVHVSAATGVLLEVRLYRFEGWEAAIDGRPVELEFEEGVGGMRLAVPAGEHDVEVRFGWTRLRSCALVVSAATLLLLVLPVGGGGWRRAVRALGAAGGWAVLVGAAIQIVVPVARRALPRGPDFHAHRARVALSYRDHHAAIDELREVDPQGPHGAWAVAELERHRVHGMRGRYFEDAAWRIPRAERMEYTLAYQSGCLTGHPAEADPVAAVCTARFDVPEDAPYDFAIESPARAALLIDGRTVVREARRNQGRRVEGAELLKRGKHELAFLYRRSHGDPGYRLWWRPPGGAWTILPLDRLEPALPPWLDAALEPFRAGK